MEGSQNRVNEEASELDREIAAEQAYVDRVYLHLDEATKAAESLAKEGYALGHIGHEGGLVERDAMVHHASRRIQAINAAHDGLVFGRLDMNDGETQYIGRIGVSDENHDVLLVDWRAPFAAAFYQATAEEPLGIVRRRVLRTQVDKIIGVEDELLDADAADDDITIIGEGALLASLSRARDHTMHSVVATIQKEQDDAIRAPVRGATIITGGPGTGKTVVALHRAAYLLYSDRRRFESGGVLVIGPSTVFMNYIERVLPSLGETAVSLRSLGSVVEGLNASRHDEARAATAKGSARMVKVLRHAVSGAQPGEVQSFRYFYRDNVLTLEAQQLDKIRRSLMSNGLKRNRAMEKAPGAVIEALWQQVDTERGLEKGRDFFARELIHDDRFIEFMEQWWPELDAVTVWRSLAERIIELGGRAFSADEYDAMIASWAKYDDPSIEDIALIDELRYLLGEVTTDSSEDEFEAIRQLMSFESEERTRGVTQSIDDDGFAHVLVDEAQDLSPMQWRMVGRRGRTASWTIVGDDAQSSWPVKEEQQLAREEALMSKDIHRFKLTKNYRNSKEIYDFAAPVARLAIDNPDLAHAVRVTNIEPIIETSSAADTRVNDIVNELLELVAGTVAVVTPLRDVDWVKTAVTDNPRVRILDALETKGLEFDAVVVYEPDAIVDESGTGWRTLYVVLTRATQRLVIIGQTNSWLEKLSAR